VPHFISDYADCHCAEVRYAECHYAECRYAKCYFAVCRGALLKATNKGKFSYCIFL
jgi:hypothetical protein